MDVFRIPARYHDPNEPKPVLVKFKNHIAKSRLMNHRKIMKQQGHRLVDDMTEKNVKLTNQLLKHETIFYVWHDSGFIYVETLEGKQYRFDKYSDINALITENKDGKEVIEDTELT